MRTQSACFDQLLCERAAACFACTLHRAMRQQVTFTLPSSDCPLCFVPDNASMVSQLHIKSAAAP